MNTAGGQSIMTVHPLCFYEVGNQDIPVCACHVFRHISLPSAAQSLIQVHLCQLTVQQGIAESDLSIEVSTLGIKQVHIADGSVYILDKSKRQCRLRRVLQVVACLVYFLHLIKVGYGIICILESRQNSFFVCISSTLVCSFCCSVASLVLAHGKIG